MLILIAGEDALFPPDLVHQIRQWGHRVENSATGRDAIIRAERMPFDLILLDVNLPDISSRIFIPQIKALHPEIMVVAMTGRNTEKLENEIRKLGISYYLTVPFLMEELKSILDHTQRVLLKKSEFGLSSHPAKADHNAAVDSSKM